jgi:4-amino-4-deoxy-L-arabinose transferase-like glycosyltransferase
VLVWLLVTGFRLWFIGSLPLTGDESYHWEWSRHLAFGYYDHPGFTAYLIRLFTFLSGTSTEFSVRLPAVAMLGVASLAAYAVARDLARERGMGEARAEASGFVAGSLLLATPLHSAMGVYISTDPPLIAAWTVALWGFTRAFRGGGLRWWAAAGAVLGLAMLSKFLAFFMIPALVLTVFVVPSLRAALRRPHPYVAAACSLAVFSPFLWWNATHGWATFMFNFVYRQKPESVSLLYGPEMIAGQFVALSPVVFVLVLGELWRSLVRGIRRRSASVLFLALSTAVPLAYLSYVSLRQRIGLHWPAAAWTGALVLLAVRAVEVWPEAAGPTRRLHAWAACICVAMTVAVHAVVHTPPRWLDFEWAYGGDPKRINVALQAERFGWKELGRRVHDTMRMMRPGEESRVFIISHEYGMCSNVSFYTPGQPPSHLWCRRKTHGENYRFWDNYPSLAGKDAVFVARDLSKATGYLPTLAAHFKDVGEPEEIRIEVDGMHVRSFYIVRCAEFDGVTPVFIPIAPERSGS